MTQQDCISYETTYIAASREQEEEEQSNYENDANDNNNDGIEESVYKNDPSANTNNGITFGCDRWPLHYACRVGDTKAVKYLVDILNVDLNEQDSHDATPLYLAALTGRNDICQYLLERGAKCDPESGGDAARVFYVALTPELRQLLRDWSLTAASRDPFIDLLRKMVVTGTTASKNNALDSEDNESYADCCIIVPEPEKEEKTTTQQSYSYGSKRRNDDNNCCFYVHQAMLALRCPTLLERVQQQQQSVNSCDKIRTNDDDVNHGESKLGDDDSTVITYKLPNDINTSLDYNTNSNSKMDKVVADLLNYVYTGWFETKNYHYAKNITTLARDWQLVDLYTALDEVISRYEQNNGGINNIIRKEKLNGRNRYNSNGKTTNIGNSDFRFREISGNLRRDMAKLALVVSQPVQKDRDINDNDSSVQVQSLAGNITSAIARDFTDFTIVFGDVEFHLHRYICCAQSAYFAKALSGNFIEAQKASIDLSYLAPSVQVLRLTIQWMYADCFVENIFTNNNQGKAFNNKDNDDDDFDTAVANIAMDLLEFSAAIVCPRLCLYIAHTALIPIVSMNNVFDMINLARLYNLERLEDKCVQILASNNLETVLNDQRLLALFASEISQIQQKGDVNVIDIPIAAEIRSYLRDTMKDDEMKPELERLLGLLDQVLQQVGQTMKEKEE